MRITYGIVITAFSLNSSATGLNGEDTSVMRHCIGLQAIGTWGLVKSPRLLSMPCLPVMWSMPHCRWRVVLLILRKLVSQQQLPNGEKDYRHIFLPDTQ